MSTSRRRLAAADFGVQRPQDPALADLPQGTVTFLLTDVEGSTGLWEQDREAMRIATTRHDEIVAGIIEAHGGVRPQEQGEGDSAVAVFTKASDAVSAAVNLQRALARERWPTAEPLRVRMAVHTGEADLRDARNYGGEAIIRAARMRALAHGGQVLVSSVTADVVADRLPVDTALVDLGVHRLKALGRPQRVFQLEHPELPDDFPPLRSLDMAKATVPVTLTSFVGRSEALAQGRSLLKDDTNRLITLVGPGGCGKTRLAATLAAEKSDEFDGEVWWVELAPVTEPDAVALAVLAVLGIGDTRGRTPLERLAQHLAGRDTLLVLDNCEHMLAGTRDLAAVLLHSCPRLTIIATSREPMGLAGETVWQVPPLDVDDAVRLFVDRAVRARPNFTLDDRTTPTVIAICERLDGIPLAIELAAARARMLAPERILAGIDDRFHLLTTGAPSGAPRQQSLRASVEWSYDLLDEREQALLRRLSVFAGAFTLDAAEQVASGESVDSLDVLDLLGHLVDRSLVAVVDDRFRLLETIRAFAADRLADAREADDARARHLEYFRALAVSGGAAIEATVDLDWLARLEDEHDDFRAALTWALGGADAHGGTALAVALIPFWAAHGHYWEGLLWLEKAADGDEPANLASLRWGMGHLRLLGMQVEAGYGYLDAEQALALARERGDESIAARALADLSMTETVLGGGQTSERFAEALAAARDAGDTWAEAFLLMSHGYTQAVLLNRHDAARPLVDQLRTFLAANPSPTMTVGTDALEAAATAQRGEPAAARPALERVLAMGREYGDPFVETFAAVSLSLLEISQGRLDAARHILDESRGWLSHSARGRIEAIDLILAVASLAEGDTAEVVDLCEAMGPAIDELGFFFLSALRLVVLTGALIERGDLDKAGSTADLAVSVAERSGNPVIHVQALTHRVAFLRAVDKADEAENAAHEVLGVAVAEQLRPEVARVLDMLAGLAIAGESWAEGVRLAGAVAAWRETSGCRAWPIEERRARADLDLARTALGNEAWEAAWAEGAALPLEEAVAYARRARGARRRPSTGWASLTPTETDVVRLVAEGLSNPDIAARLFVSRATVKTHLVHVFSKLGVASRAELAAAATRRGVG